jgi:L-threonylcarbamoyladenylate synthase
LRGSRFARQFIMTPTAYPNVSPNVSPNRVAAEAPGAIQTCANTLALGGLVAIPTETVYGLAARADDDAAVAAIYALKGRPSDHPLIVHVQSAADVPTFAEQLPDVAARLMAHFWPGPLTVVLRRRAGMAAAACAQQPTVALRCPSHPVAQALLAACKAAGVPGLAAPSANRFGRVSPTTAAHVVHEFTDPSPAQASAALTVLDGGPCEVGIESAIVDVSRGRAVLLRPGALSQAALSQAAGTPVLTVDEDAVNDALNAVSPVDGAKVPRASGTLQAHYAPRAKVRVMPTAMLRDALRVLAEGAPGSLKLAVYSRTIQPAASTPTSVLHRPMAAQAPAAAHELYATLRSFDDAGVSLIWVEALPHDSAWDGVRDRLHRAAASA